MKFVGGGGGGVKGRKERTCCWKHFKKGRGNTTRQTDVTRERYRNTTFKSQNPSHHPPAGATTTYIPHPASPILTTITAQPPNRPSGSAHCRSPEVAHRHARTNPWPSQTHRRPEIAPLTESSAGPHWPGRSMVVSAADRGPGVVSAVEWWRGRRLGVGQWEAGDARVMSGGRLLFQFWGLEVGEWVGFEGG